MRVKDKILNLAGDKYSCLESFEVVTITNDSDNLALSYEISDNELAVNVIDTEAGSLIDNYSTECDEDCINDKIATAVTTFENIQKLNKNNKLKAKKSVNESESIEKLVGDKGIMTLDAQDLKQMKKTVNNDNFNNDQLKQLMNHCLDGLISMKEYTSVESKASNEDDEDLEVLCEEDDEKVDVTISDETLNNVSCDNLISNVVNRVEAVKDMTEDETSKVILDDISLQLDGIKEELINLEVE